MKTDNELIAEFMDIQVYQTWEEMRAVPIEKLGIWSTPDKLNYDKSWDKLIPVIQKVFNTEFGDHFEQWRKLNGKVMNALGTLDITFTHTKVVEFIKWYNSLESK